MWVTKLLISPVKKGFFAPKRPNLAQNLHFWSILARPCRLHRCPVSGSDGGCGARAVSRKTPIYFIFINQMMLTLHAWLKMPPPSEDIAGLGEVLNDDCIYNDHFISRVSRDWN